jgi:hypothetical protein
MVACNPTLASLRLLDGPHARHRRVVRVWRVTRTTGIFRRYVVQLDFVPEHGAALNGNAMGATPQRRDRSLRIFTEQLQLMGLD